MDKNELHFLTLQTNKMLDYFNTLGVDINKIRFVTTPNFLYDYTNNIVSPINGLYDGKLVKSGPVVILSVNQVEVDENTFGELINSSKLGYVVYLSDLSKSYVDGRWPLYVRIHNIDEAVALLGEFDDTWCKNDGYTLSDKIQSICTYFDSINSPINYLIVNPILVPILESEVEFDKANSTLLGLKIKLNPNLKDDIISLTSTDESFYLKVDNG